MTVLHDIGQIVREFLLTVPLPVARGVFLTVPTLVLIWVLTLPASETTAPEHEHAWSGNLKVVAAVALLLQIAIYSLLS